MVHVASLLAVFLYTLQHTDIDESIGEQQTEELAFHCLELGFVLGCSFHVLGSALTLCLLVYLLHQLVVCCLEVGGANVVCIADVLANLVSHHRLMLPIL